MTNSKNGTSLKSPTSLFAAVLAHAISKPQATALTFKGECLTYQEFADLVIKLSFALGCIGVTEKTRVAVLLPNCPEAIISAFSTFEAGGIHVPVNPLLRPRQIQHVLSDCGANVLLTTRYLFEALTEARRVPANLKAIIFTDTRKIKSTTETSFRTYDWSELISQDSRKEQVQSKPRDNADATMIFYTSGSTGRSKGVLISHRNLLDGVRIVSGYLGNTSKDRILAALPLSFDYGFSQVTTALYVGAEVVLTNYSLPQQLLIEAKTYKVTGLAGVPTMWSQLMSQDWPAEIGKNLRYVTNSGGRLHPSIITQFRRQLPKTQIYSMYGLTEAFRSTFLDPRLLNERRGSIGKAVAGVSLHVVNHKGDLCGPHEEGELVHAGSLVSLGYWNNPDATARRFRELPASVSSDKPREIGVWTGDIVKKDDDGFIYFVERTDAMLKCSGYRISPAEIEEVIYESGLVKQVVAIGLPDENLGQRVGLAIVPNSIHEDNDFAIRHVCARELPPYMQPDEVLVLERIPMTANVKPDRLAVSKMFALRPLPVVD